MPEISQFKNKNITIMGLGLHGGGLSSALFFINAGANVTVTDMKTREQLSASIEKLKNQNVRLVLGEHREEDFSKAHMIIKNPGVPRTSRFLQIAKKNNVPVESDISIFLGLTKNPVIAVTGSKGKSTTVSAVYHGIKTRYPEAQLGGNITRSPLSFIHDLKPDTPVVLELSSWQLADLENKGILRARVSAITNILPDHMNSYTSMDEYFRDKQLIYQDQGSDDFSLFYYDDPYLRTLDRDSPAQSMFFSDSPLPLGLQGAWLTDTKEGICRIGNTIETILARELSLAGEHNRRNLLLAALILKLFGLKARDISQSLSQFTGIEHRMECFLKKGDLCFYNDSAATIPQAVVEAVKSLAKPIYLITGGTDKKSDYKPMSEIAALPEKIFLLKGSGTKIMEPILKASGGHYFGPFENLDILLDELTGQIGQSGSVILSPGSASFELFENEFDRGRQFKAGIQKRFA